MRPRSALRGWTTTGLSLLLLFCPLLVSAAVVQIPWPRALGLADGLPTTDIRAVGEDATGYLWLASSDGLLRFDGQRFRTLRSEVGLPDVDLRGLHVDARDRIWLATATQGVVMLGVDRITFERAAAAAPLAVRSGHVRQVTSSGDGRIWIIGDDQRLYVRPAEQPDWQLQALGEAPLTLLATDRDGAVWVGSGTHLWRREGEAFQRVPLPPEASAGLQTLWADPAGGVEVSTRAHAWSLDRSGRLRAGTRTARTLLRGRDGVVWRQAAHRLQWQRPGGSPAAVRLPGPAVGSGTVQVRQLLQDRQGDLWWVSEDHGLWWLPAHWSRFTALPAVADTGTGQAFHPVLGLAASGRDHAWVASADGSLQRLDLRSGRTAHPVAYASARTRPAPVGVAEDPQGRVWVAAAGQLIRYDRAVGRLRQWPLGTVAPGTASSVQVCAQDQVWVAAGASVQRWSMHGVRLLDARPEQIGLSADVPARQLLCTRDGEIWATDPAGLMRWSSAHARFQRADDEEEGAVTALAAADDGTFWVARHAAVERYRALPGTVQQLRRIGVAEGYPQLRAHALALDARGRVWAGAARGLVRVDPGAGEVTLFGVPQGVPVQEVLPQRLVRLGSGALVAAVREGGLLAFDPAALPLPPAVPVLVVDAMTRRRHDRMMAVAFNAGPVQLSTADRNVRVAVSLLGRGDPDRIRHRFRLLGHDPGWIDTGPVVQRIFERLPAGEHVLLMQARHAEGPWSAVRELRLRVVPQWWQTVGGRTALALAGFACFVLLSRLFHWQRRRHRHHRQARSGCDLAELDSLQRTRFLARLGRQIRMPMTPVLGWSELLLTSPLSPTQRTQVGSLHQAGHHLLQLLDDALDLADIEAGRLQLTSAPFALQALLDELHGLLLPVAQTKAIALHWHNALAHDSCYLGDVQRLRQILLNLLGNAVKFTARGDVSLSAHEGEGGQGLVLVIADTGPGMSVSQVQRLFQRFDQTDGARTLGHHGGSGLGLAISQDLARAMGGRIEVASQAGHGTRMTLHLPWCPVPAAPAVTSTDNTAADGDSLRVMVLLPSASVADVVCALLRAQGHRVVGVDDLESWVTHVDPGPWDLIAADPDMLVAGERASARLPWLWPGVPRLALSPRADTCAEREALAAGFEMFLRLPLTGPRLAAALAHRRNPA